MLLDFHKHIDNNFSFFKNKKILIAVSGGLDSVVLTHLLFPLKIQFSLAHCNFRLRGKASDLDEEFVKNLARDLQIKIYVKSFDTVDYAKDNNLSIQMAARELRYEWFKVLLKNEAFDYVLTAHHADDNLETFLINFSRGTGLDGLTGIPSINENIIRPLLPFSRLELENYANNNNISWREDMSNAETKYLRNKLRHDVIPLLKEINPSFLDSFALTTEHLNASKQILTDRVDEIKKQVIIEENGMLKLDITLLYKLSDPKAYLYELLKAYGFTAWNDVSNLLSAQSGKFILSKTHRLLKDREYLILSKNLPKKKWGKVFEIDQFDDKISLPFLNLQCKTISVQNFENENLVNNNPKNVYIDKSLLKFPLKVRKWENGDYFYPLGMQGKKKLSKYFTEIKLSILQKEDIWLICSENKIVWILNYRMDNRFKITSQTKNILNIKII